ncbi:hypothetical protein GRI97_12715 [Altererythrobacter xixiisoli]|uniref:Uncharacterized protein n=2 Tax=Croceibacterium xixiisoli TaxID=1476466 RepID=A0A6I4TYY8_9SPHN|nr:hypothetical protein [Croceibacterium xixiisoli]
MIHDHHLNIWVNNVQQFQDKKFIVSGFQFNGEFGFGVEGKKCDEGEFFLISSFGKERVFAGISYVHTRDQHMTWSLSGPQIPQSPFLITSCQDIEYFECGFVEFFPSGEAEKIFSRDGERNYPILSKSFIGILRFGYDGFFMFKYYFKEKPYLEEKVFFSEWNIEAGLVTGL